MATVRLRHFAFRKCEFAQMELQSIFEEGRRIVLKAERASDMRMLCSLANLLARESPRRSAKRTYQTEGRENLALDKVARTLDMDTCLFKEPQGSEVGGAPDLA